MVTHDQEEAMGVSDRIVVMSRGHVEQVGTPEDVYRAPASAFVAGFVGRSSAFDAKVEATPGTLDVHGTILPADAARGILYGTPVRAFVRPEDVRLGRHATALAGAMEAEVTHLEFLGATCRITLERPHLRIEADASPDLVREIGAVPGARLPMALPADRLLVFRTDV
jgi:iron(III) transport system ATP-binding protein